MWRLQRWWRLGTAGRVGGGYHGARGTSYAGRQALLLLAPLLVCISLPAALVPSPEVALVIFAIPCVALAAFIWPQLALLALGAGAGLPALLLPLPGHRLHLVEPLLLLCLVVVIVRRPGARLSLPHLLALAFLLLALISFLHVPQSAMSAWRGEAYGADKRLLELCIIFGSFFCATLLAAYIRSCTRFLLAILLVNLPLYLVGLAQCLHIRLASWLEATGANSLTLTQGRLWGPFPWSVNFAMYLVNIFAVALACWLLGRRRWERLSGALMTLVTALSIIGTGTRSVASAALIAALLAFAVTRHFKLLGGVLLLALTAATLFSKHIALFFTHNETSTANRLLIWNLALQLIQLHPWLGIGLQQFHYYYAQLVVSREHELGALGVHPHQQYLEWAMESGIPWLALGVLFLLSVVIQCARAYYARGTTHGQRTLLLAAGLAMLANIFIGFFDAPLDQLEGPVLLFLLAGLALGHTSPHRAISVQARGAATWLARPLPLHSSQARRVEPISPSREDIWQAARPQVHQEEVRPLNSASHDGTGERPDGGGAGRTLVFQLLSWGIALPLIVPTTALLARYLGPVQYGEYSLTFPFLTIFALLSGTGMDPLVMRDLSRQPRAAWSSILSYALGSRLISTLTSAGAAALVACLLPIEAGQRDLFLIGSASLLFSFSFNGVRIIFSHGFRAEQRVGALAIIEAANRLLTAGLVALVVMLRLSLHSIYVILIYSDLPAFLLQAWLAHRRYDMRPRLSLTRLRAHMLTSLPLAGHRILSFLAGQLDLFLLSVESTPLNVGLYALASRLTDPLISIAHAYVTSLYPLLCDSFKEDRRRFAALYSEALRLLLLVAVPCVVIADMEMDDIVQLVGGAAFSAAAGVVRILLGAMLLTFLNQLAEGACTAANLERRILPITAISTLVNIGANLLLIPRWHIVGAALATLSGEVLMLVLFTFLLRKYIHPLHVGTTVMGILACNIPALAVLRWQSVATPIIAIPVALLLSVASYLLTGLLTRADISRVWQIK